MPAKASPKRHRVKGDAGLSVRVMVRGSNPLHDTPEMVRSRTPLWRNSTLGIFYMPEWRNWQHANASKAFPERGESSNLSFGIVYQRCGGTG